MTPIAASQTAEWAAVCRAVESRKDPAHRVCFDPMAERLLRPELRLLGRLLPARLLARLLDRRFPWAVREIVARTRCIDDHLTRRLAEGLEQLVILGAGLDSRAYRISGLARVRVFEVDHPATQRGKVARLERVLGSLPAHVVHVPVDFGTDRLDACLAEVGYRTDADTLFICEGVTMYLTADAVDNALAFVVQRSAPGSSVVFNYVYRSVVDGTCTLPGAREWARRLAAMGEPVRFGIDEGAVEAFLAARGFCEVENFAGEDFDRMYFAGTLGERAAIRFLATACARARSRRQELVP